MSPVAVAADDLAEQLQLRASEASCRLPLLCSDDLVFPAQSRSSPAPRRRRERNRRARVTLRKRVRGRQPLARRTSS